MIQLNYFLNSDQEVKGGPFYHHIKIKYQTLLFTFLIKKRPVVRLI